MISVEQYERALKELSKSRLEMLKRLYVLEPAKDSNEIAYKLGYKGRGGANLQIGLIGRAICKSLNIKPDLSDYNPKIKDKGYFIVIHREYRVPNTYWDMEPNLRRAIENYKILNITTSEEIEYLPTEVIPLDHEYSEGSVIQVLVNRYERNKIARGQALSRHGNKCFGCQIDFKLTYGHDIKDIIEFHHITPLKNRINSRKTNPKSDLVPLCPNCHAVVHSTNPVMSIDHLKLRIKKNRC